MVAVVRIDWSEIVLYVTGGIVVVTMVFLWSTVQRHEPPPGVAGAMPYGGLELNRASLNVYNHPSFDSAAAIKEMGKIADALVLMNRDDSIMMAGLSPIYGGFQVVCNIISRVFWLVVVIFWFIVFPCWFWCHK
nr:triple-gene-block protein 15K [Rice stripe necrosis virus]